MDNFSFDTQYQVVAFAGKLPLGSIAMNPLYMSGSQQREISEIFDRVKLSDPNFKNYLRRAINQTDERIDVARSREEKPSIDIGGTIEPSDS